LLRVRRNLKKRALRGVKGFVSERKRIDPASHEVNTPSAGADAERRAYSRDEKVGWVSKKNMREEEGG